MRGDLGPTITVEAYDPDWPRLFHRLCRPVREVLGELAVAIEHVGSTAVPGLAAKPIIDMSVVVAFTSEIPAAIERLARLGYRHRSDLGVEGREAFHAPHDLPRHHLYLCPAGSLGVRNHLAVRDYLRSDPVAVRRYGDLKSRLAHDHPNDIDAYIAGKTAFLLDILRRSSLTPEELGRIERANAALL